ncbi:MAG: hypothetical protein RL226_2237 [Bacteroidota bacterium]
MKYALLSAIQLLALAVAAQMKPVALQAPITRATVYLQGAVVTHEAQVNLQAGDNVLLLSGLTVNMDPGSIVVKGGEGLSIGGVFVKNNFSATPPMSEAARAKTDSLEEARLSRDEKMALRAVYEEELLFLQANRSIKGDESALLVEDVEEMANFFRERIREIKYKTIEINEQEKELSQRIQRLSNELANMGNLNRQNVGAIEIRLNATTAGKKDIAVSYYSGNAGWWPIYDLRAEDLKGNVSLHYKGMVYQQFGSDWNDVTLTLSTGNPVIGGNPPTLYPWQIYFRNNNYRKDKSEDYAREQPMMMDMAGEEARIDAKVISSQNAEIRDVVVNTEFVLPGKLTIPSDGQGHEFENQRITLPATFRHLAVPKLDPSAFLTSTVTDWEQYSLLPGEASIYFQDAFVGKSYIDPSAGDDTLQLSFGKDAGIVVKRDQIKEFCKSTVLGLKTKTSRAYSIKVVNNHKKPMNMRVEDQIPLSTNGDIEVEVEELSGGKLDPETGKVVWDITVEPGASKELELRFSVKHPRKKPLANL